MLNYSEELKISLGGENHVDVKTLTSVLQGTLRSVEASTSHMIDDHTTSKLVVKSVKEGSFVIECLVYIHRNSKTIINSVNAAKSILDTFKTGLELRQHLKGEDPKDVKIDNNTGTVSIININNSKIEIGKEVLEELSTNNELRKGITNIYKELEEDKDRSYIEFDFDNGSKTEKILVKKEEIPQMRVEPELTKYLSTVEENIMKTTIRITRLDFQRNIKWQFILNGKTESAYIEDEEFLEDVKSNKYMFGANTYIKATIKSVYRIDDQGFPIQTEKAEFTILKVHNVIDGKIEQKNLFS